MVAFLFFWHDEPRNFFFALAGLIWTGLDSFSCGPGGECAPTVARDCEAEEQVYMILSPSL